VFQSRNLNYANTSFDLGQRQPHAPSNASWSRKSQNSRTIQCRSHRRLLFFSSDHYSFRRGTSSQSLDITCHYLLSSSRWTLQKDRSRTAGKAMITVDRGIHIKHGCSPVVPLINHPTFPKARRYFGYERIRGERPRGSPSSNLVLMI
jgi:hypothetical protein